MVQKLVLAVMVTFAALAPAFAVDSNEDATPDLAPVRELIKKQKWTEAVEALEQILPSEHTADSYNLLGFSLRKLGKAHYAASLSNYLKALRLDPRHRQAREYLGELYVQMGNLTKAKAERDMLRKLCPNSCEELIDIEKAIKAAEGAQR